MPAKKRVVVVMESVEMPVDADPTADAPYRNVLLPVEHLVHKLTTRFNQYAESASPMLAVAELMQAEAE